jgi:superfamily I DNA/RNA helicase/mRNA-degrading endonuclease RelE of RelBE toxin-antitoxin system
LDEDTTVTYEIAHSEGFPLELGRAPRKVHNAYQKTIVPELKSRPETADPPRIKKLSDYKSLWRYRVSDEWRLVYRVDPSEHLVTMLMLGHRGSVYERLGMGEDGNPGIRIIAHAPELLEREPTEKQVGHAVIQLAAATTDPPTQPNSQLPMQLTPELLAEWSVPSAYATLLAGVDTEARLWELAEVIPESVLERVLNGIWPPSIEEVVQRPVHMSESPEAVLEAAAGERPLSSFLLKLDDVQKSFVAKFEQSSTGGPWLVKGGPGSGKSTVAVYCARALQRKSAESATGSTILYTTFTNALTNASEYLIRELDGVPMENPIRVSTVDKLVYECTRSSFRFRLANNREQWEPHLKKSIAECAAAEGGTRFWNEDTDFIHKEIDWVIFGQDLRTVEAYESADRRGRGRRLTAQQRRTLWRIHVAFRESLHAARFALASEFAAEAARIVKPKFDYVFIDEAQDLKPVHIRFAVGLCRSPEGVFLTADGNQSIYGNGISWRSVAEDLRFGGRVRTLTRNYRTTKEIWQALEDLAPNTADADPETLEVASVFRGPCPRFVRYRSEATARRRLNDFIRNALHEERVGPSCAAVLCPTNRKAEEVSRWIDNRLNPKVMKSSELDLDHRGVKVMTIHASKGLQFPIVVVAGVEAEMPRPGTSPLDQAEESARSQRLLFVGCSRAMRQLLVLGNQMRPSPLAARISDEHWEIEEL